LNGIEGTPIAQPVLDEQKGTVVEVIEEGGGYGCEQDGGEMRAYGNTPLQGVRWK